MEFNLTEKLAIVKFIDEIVLVDGEVTEGELNYLNQLMNVLNFDSSHIQEARKLNPIIAITIIRGMSKAKKLSLGVMLNEMANSDDDFHEKEAEFIANTLTLMNIDFSEGRKVEIKNEFELDLSDVYFESSAHKRIENGIPTSEEPIKANRAMKIEPNINGDRGYTVTAYNLDGVHPTWGNNVQMSPKPMRVVTEADDYTVLRGYGVDSNAFGLPAGNFSDYGITVHYNNSGIDKIVLHMHDRNIDIEYFE